MSTINHTINLNNNSVNARLNEFAKFLNTNQNTQNHFKRVEALVKNKLRLENHLKLLQSYSEQSRMPPALVHERFPRCMFNNSTNPDYFIEYNRIVEICQKSLLDLNIKEVKLMIEKSKKELYDLKKFIDTFDDKTNQKFNEIDTTQAKNADKFFLKLNENFNREIQKPIRKFPILKEKKINREKPQVNKEVANNSNKNKNVKNSDRNLNKTNKKHDPSILNNHLSRNVTQRNNENHPQSNRSKSSHRFRSKSNSRKYDNGNSYSRSSSNTYSNNGHKKTNFTLSSNNVNYNNNHNTPVSLINSNMERIKANHNVRSSNNDQVFRLRQNSTIRT